MKSIMLKIGKERNMTFPKDILALLEVDGIPITEDDLAKGMLVCEPTKIILGDGRTINKEEVDRLLSRGKNNV